MPSEIEVRFEKLREDATQPAYAHGASEDAGMDLFSAEEVDLEPREWKCVGTGIAIELPDGYEGQVRPRSGLARKHGLTLLNSPGTIDPGYRGEVRVTLINLGTEKYSVKKGDRIAQLIVGSYAGVRWRLSESLNGSSRGNGGFGSTGR